jgi:hypothetical protein
MAERQQRSSGRSSDTIASFLLKTYEILEVDRVVGSIPKIGRSSVGTKTRLDSSF